MISPDHLRTGNPQWFNIFLSCENYHAVNTVIVLTVFSIPEKFWWVVSINHVAGGNDIILLDNFWQIIGHWTVVK